MSIKAVVAVVILGSSSVAAAAGTPDQVAYQPMEHRTLPALGIGFLGHVVEKPAPMVLANDSRVAGRMAIKNVATSRAFTKIELRANDGRTTIGRVVIDYGNGRTRIVRLNRVVYGTKALSIELTGSSRSIKSIVVVGSSKRGASIDVFAS